MAELAKMPGCFGKGCGECGNTDCGMCEDVCLKCKYLGACIRVPDSISFNVIVGAAMSHNIPELGVSELLVLRSAMQDKIDSIDIEISTREANHGLGN